MNKPLTIGILAKKSDVNIETIRYYQRISLLTEPEKPLQGYRVYPQQTINRIRFIKRAQQLGFSLQEIADLLQLGEGQCSDICARAEQKRLQIEQQIKDLKNLRNTLDTLISECHNEKSTSCCPIIEALTSDKNT
ncbi:Transcriptional regulator, MerR family [hydrothermal vent metagenome]|uniref:Mercuric resistance operon regulatory protein n=1 Tax=hydrothermal vent metagenome TaxID=652676 RepID=A0A3B0Y3P5_9ZZZZ